MKPNHYYYLCTTTVHMTNGKSFIVNRDKAQLHILYKQDVLKFRWGISPRNNWVHRKRQELQDMDQWNSDIN